MDIRMIFSSLAQATKNTASHIMPKSADRPGCDEKLQSPTSKLATLYLQIWMYQIVGLIIFATARIAFINKFVTIGELSENIENMPMFLFNSFRFDMQSISYISLPMIIAALIVSFIKKESITKQMSKVMRHYFAVILTLIALLSIAEFYYYDNFETRYNIVFFDFLDEGPIGLLKTMWEDYPIISIMMGVIVIYFTINIIGCHISRMRIRQRSWMGKTSAITFALLIPVATFIFLRGSVTLYTLQVEAFEVTPNPDINKTVPNSLYILKKAYKERINSFKLNNDAEILSENGYKSIDDVVSAANLKQNNPNGTDLIERTIFNIMEHRDSFPPERPNVLLIMNESWSSFLLHMDKEEELDLLCSLRSHLEEDLLMQNIQSVENGTIYSIESTILAMPYPHYFQSRFRFVNLESSIAYPFHMSGYDTRFISGADPTWENLNEALKKQYFKRIDGRQQILHSIKGSSTSQIGAYDEFLYEYILKEMEQAAKNGTPQFFMALTTTNHPPFEFPDGIHLPPLTNEWYNSQYLKGEDDVKKKYGLGAQYSNKCLGDFMKDLKQSALADNTIVIAIGDHNVRSILDFNTVPERYRYNVPMYIYLPPKYALNLEQKQKISKRYGCHYDILPTIARYAFKDGIKYLNIGQDLFDTENDDNSYFSYNVNKIQATDETTETKSKETMRARTTLMKLYYQRIFRNSEE